MALGSSYEETGGTNASDLHWDLVCDLRNGGEILADGRRVYRDGRFVPELALGS
jgi:aminopeptidase